MDHVMNSHRSIRLSLSYLLVDLESPPDGRVVERVEVPGVRPSHLGRVEGEVGTHGLIQGEGQAAAGAEGSAKANEGLLAQSKASHRSARERLEKNED